MRDSRETAFLLRCSAPGFRLRGEGSNPLRGVGPTPGWRAINFQVPHASRSLTLRRTSCAPSAERSLCWTTIAELPLHGAPELE